MHHPDPNYAEPQTPLLESESHVIYGYEPSVSMLGSDAAAALGWNLATVGGSWHIWNYESIMDRLDLPLWPTGLMNEVRIVFSTEACRQKIYLPQAPFMPPRGVEHCGVHISASANPALSRKEEIVHARSRMRQWLSVFMGWSAVTNNDQHAEDNKSAHNPNLQQQQEVPADSYDFEVTEDNTPSEAGSLGPESFIDVAKHSIYYFQPFETTHQLSGHQGSRLDLMHFAVGSHHILNSLASPQVLQRGRKWLDNHRIEIGLRQTPHGFVKISIQAVSLLHPSSDIDIVSLANSTSQLAWIGPTTGSNSFFMTAGQPAAVPLDIPSAFYARHDTTTQPAGSMTESTKDFYSFHPSLRIAAKADHIPRLGSGSCRIDTLVVLPSTYFFDPYQLHDLQGQLGSKHRHYGPIELERPAEAMPNWGSVLHLSQHPHREDFDAVVPIHARYRLPPVHGRTVGPHGEPGGTTHVETALLPAISAVVCPVAQISRFMTGSKLLNSLNVRAALFDELGLEAFAVLQPSPDTDTLLRMPVGNAGHSSLIRIATLLTFLAGSAFVAWFVHKSLLLSPKSIANNIAVSKNDKGDKQF
ncbi:protease B nonderepressible form [Coemansia asiatica]|uniref:Protein PBN1 n=1 Tax=Coemansia asiatica TaxID=1052880 RepID=A0A9W7XF37_9FUNG|nr:protease B nonderepressible form [Coemansia asiatica]